MIKSSPADLVTATDQKVEKMLLSFIKEKYPSHRYFLFQLQVRKWNLVGVNKLDKILILDTEIKKELMWRVWAAQEPWEGRSGRNQGGGPTRTHHRAMAATAGWWPCPWLWLLLSAWSQLLVLPLAIPAWYFRHWAENNVLRCN